MYLRGSQSRAKQNFHKYADPVIVGSSRSGHGDDCIHGAGLSNPYGNPHDNGSDVLALCVRSSENMMAVADITTSEALVRTSVAVGLSPLATTISASFSIPCRVLRSPELPRRDIRHLTFPRRGLFTSFYCAPIRPSRRHLFVAARAPLSIADIRQAQQS